MQANEQLTIDQARQGDHDAFARLMGKYQDRLFTSLTQHIGCEAEAEDIVQETFVKAYLKLSTFQGNSSFYTWIYSIARNVASSRRQRLRPAWSLESTLQSMGQEPADRAASAMSSLEREEQVDHLAKALDSLTPDYRSILVLREIDGFDYATIASLLEISVGTVRSRLHRARVELARVCRLLKGADHDH